MPDYVFFIKTEQPMRFSIKTAEQVTELLKVFGPGITCDGIKVMNDRDQAYFDGECADTCQSVQHYKEQLDAEAEEE